MNVLVVALVMLKGLTVAGVRGVARPACAALVLMLTSPVALIRILRLHRLQGAPRLHGGRPARIAAINFQLPMNYDL